MTPTLRIIMDPHRTAAFNMAADLDLLEQASHDHTVFLRFYTWSPPAISLGCMQKAEETLNLAAMKEHDVEWVKRPTGGRAILHWNDLTYACVFPSGISQMGSSITETYAVISRCLMAGLVHAGIRCETHDSSAEYALTKREIKLPCFLSPNRNEIMVKGKKLIGSAQKRTERAVLQHGSIPIDRNFRRLPEFCAVGLDERALQVRQLEEKCACVRELDPSIDANTLTRCLIRGFCEILKLEAEEQPWSEELFGKFP